MAKNMDGIKKLNQEEIKKYREIVLNYIGEKDAAAPEEIKRAAPGNNEIKRVDGLNLSAANSGGSKAAAGLRKKAVNTGKILSGVKEEMAKIFSRKEDDRLKEAVKRQEEERKRIMEEEKSFQREAEEEEEARREKIRLEKEKIEQEKAEQTEKARLAKEREKKARREKEEKAKQEKIKKLLAEEEAKERAEQERLKQAEKEKQEKARQEEEKRKSKELALKKRREEEERIKAEVLKAKEMALMARREALKKRRAEEEKRWQERLKLEEEERGKRRRIKENLRLEKMKRREEIKKVREELRLKERAQREKIRIKRRKAFKKYKKNILLKIRIFYALAKKNIGYVIFYPLLSAAILYLLICLAVLRFNFNSAAMAAILKYLPMPAVISSQGVMSYNDYLKIAEDDYTFPVLDLREKKNFFVRRLIIRSLEKKYGESNALAAADFSARYALDKDYNGVALSRINKINELLNNQANFESLGKYADEYNTGAYYEPDHTAEKFSPAVKELAPGQSSGIIPKADGYYIVKRMADQDEQIGVKYIFVKAETLEDYIKKKAEKAIVFILAD